jgi:hypothetical protein
MTLSGVGDLARGRKKMLMISAMRPNEIARTWVALVRKSAVRRTPKTIPTDPPPNVPARPPPLLACISTTRIRRIARTSSTIIKRVNIQATMRCDTNIESLIIPKYVEEINPAPYPPYPQPRNWSSVIEEPASCTPPCTNFSIYFPTKSNSRFTFEPGRAAEIVVLSSV